MERSRPSRRRVAVPAESAAARGPKVHGRGEARLDAVLDLAEEASRAAPLDEVLAALTARIAAMLAVDVCSIYLREHDGTEGDRRVSGDLVLRATHGYAAAQVGQVRMRVGEGLTGFAVECMRPVSVARAEADARNKPFAGLDEARFPSLCALPLVDGGRAVGALVIQRRRPHAFGQREIVLVASLAAPVLFALEKARHRERAERAAHTPPAPARVHEVSLRGQPAAPGCALGTLVVRRHALAAPGRRGAAPADAAEEHARLGAAIAEAAGELAALVAWALAPAERHARLRALVAPARFVLDDARLRERLQEHVDEGARAEEAVERVAREYARVLSAAGDAHLEERALEVEALCQRVLARLGAPLVPLPAGAVLAAGRLTVCDALELGMRHGAGAVLAAPAAASSGLEVARALGLPVVAAVRELYRWVSDGDRLLVDGDGGGVVVNPSRVEVARHRRR